MTDHATLTNYCQLGVQLVVRATETVRRHLRGVDGLSVRKLRRNRLRAAESWAWLCGCRTSAVSARDVYAISDLDARQVESDLGDEFRQLNGQEFSAVCRVADNCFVW